MSEWRILLNVSIFLISNVEGLVEFALKEGIDLTVVGPESALSLGIS